MIDEIVASFAGGEGRIALRSAGRVVEIEAAGQGAPDTLGAVVLGRVNAIVPGMEAAFVDIGAERAGFLSLIPPRAVREGEETEGEAASWAPLNEGDRVLVQVTKAAQAGKGAGLTRAVSLPGRYLVLTPMRPRIAISRRIEDEARRAALEAAMAGIAGEGEGFILRTAAADADAGTLARDAEDLRALWAEIEARAEATAPPAVLHGEARGLAEVLRDHARAGLRRVIVDTARAEEEVRAFIAAHLPESGARVERWAGPETLFEGLGIADELARALEPEVALPCGGSLIIEGTHALTAIDVNTARNTGRASHAETVLATNLEAAEEIPRQLRLRGVGGISVIDFIHMEDEDARGRVVEVLMAGLREDPAFIRAGSMSELGLVELARKRGAGPLGERLGAAGPRG